MAMTERRAADRMRSMLAPLGAAAVVTAGVAYLAAVDPNTPGHYPPCPLYFLTGLYCPGCGTLRAVHDLANADLSGALGMNPLFVICVPFVLFLWGRWAIRSWRREPARTTLPHPAYLWSFFAFVIIFGVVRNMPFGRFLAP